MRLDASRRSASGFTGAANTCCAHVWIRTATEFRHGQNYGFDQHRRQRRAKFQAILSGQPLLGS